jgi:flagellar biogenesis protein FliO
MSMFSSTVTMLGGLCFCLGIFAVAVRFLRRFSVGGGPARRRRIEVRERMALSSKASVFLVAVDNREYLIAQGSDSVSVTPTHSMTTPLFTESLDEVCAEVGELHA